MVRKLKFLFLVSLLGSVLGYVLPSEASTIGPDFIEEKGRSPSSSDEKWLKIKLPVMMIYYSTTSSHHGKITSSEHCIDNHSKYPVRVVLSSYNNNGPFPAETTGIETLSLTGSSGTVPLVKDGKAESFDTTQHSAFMFDLGTEGTTKQGEFKASHTVIFRFSGFTKSSLISKEINLNNNLIFKLIPLNEKGHKQESVIVQTVNGP